MVTSVHTDSPVKNEILKLALSGAEGTASDFIIWLNGFGIRNITPEQVHNCLEELAAEGRMISRTLHSICDYRISSPVEHNQFYNYKVFSDKRFSAIQLIRSRIESFLRYFRVREEEQIDIVIALTEALENAVKYSDREEIEVSYTIEDLQSDSDSPHSRRFRLEIKNHAAESSPHEDILSGKYADGSITLMKGLKVMYQLFDELDLNLDHGSGVVTLKASKKLE